ncbi:MAG: RDD family protein [Acidimicrobiales bacterium]|nr:RDD family protein [Acidimicrobiales bacterium]
MSDMPAPPPPPPGGAPPPPPSGGPAPAGSGNLAGVGQRFGALLIDGIVVGIPFAILFFIALAVAPTELEACTVDGQFGICEVLTGGGVAIVGLAWLIGVVGIVYYFAKGEGAGQTVGKKALNIKVVDAVTGQPIGTGRAVGRYFSRIISGLPCYLGYFWALWDPNRETFHDKIVKTHVVNA